MPQQLKRCTWRTLAVIQVLTVAVGVWYSTSGWIDCFNNRLDLVFILSCVCIQFLMFMVVIVQPRLFGTRAFKDLDRLIIFGGILLAPMGSQLGNWLIRWYRNRNNDYDLWKRHLPGFVMFTIFSIFCLSVGGICGYVFLKGFSIDRNQKHTLHNRLNTFLSFYHQDCLSPECQQAFERFMTRTEYYFFAADIRNEVSIFYIRALLVKLVKRLSRVPPVPLDLCGSCGCTFSVGDRFVWDSRVVLPQPLHLECLLKKRIEQPYNTRTILRICSLLVGPLTSEVH